jgi:leucyl aminopeptidase
MNFKLSALDLNAVATLPASALVLLVGENFTPGQDALSIFAGRMCYKGDFKYETGAVLTTLTSSDVSGIKVERITLLGIGDRQPAHVRKAIAGIAGMLKSARFNDITFCFAQSISEATLEAATLAIRDSLYFYSTTKTVHSKSDPPQIEDVTIVVPTLENTALEAAFARANAIGEGIALAREWGNRPANYATPTMLATVAESLAELPHIKCEIMEPKEIAKLGMGAFMAVAQGSDQDARLIILRYQGTEKQSAPIVLVGKGITFDSGGISLKPAAEMDEMKFDMCGAASVLGAFRAIAELQPEINVIGIIPATENLPSGRAIKPGDVVRSHSGQTIEILNTDAEGRLILCDALSYAQHYEPRVVIDIATLTGACMVALGSVRSGMFSNDDALAAELLAAGERALDLCWRMPLDDEYGDGLKTAFADVANVAGRAAGAVTAAKFLQRFVNRFPWAHLDIAGTAWKGSSTSKGSTGRPVGLLVHYLLSVANTLTAAPPNAPEGKDSDKGDDKPEKTKDSKGGKSKRKKKQKD